MCSTIFRLFHLPKTPKTPKKTAPENQRSAALAQQDGHALRPADGAGAQGAQQPHGHRKDLHQTTDEAQRHGDQQFHLAEQIWVGLKMGWIGWIGGFFFEKWIFGGVGMGWRVADIIFGELRFTIFFCWIEIWLWLNSMVYGRYDYSQWDL